MRIKIKSISRRVFFYIKPVAIMISYSTRQIHYLTRKLRKCQEASGKIKVTDESITEA
jgi:hypothetical protein